MNQQKNERLENLTPRSRWRTVLHEVIFEADTPAGKAFDVVLIISILLSVTAVMLDSIDSVRARHMSLLYGIEWFFTLLFTVEYILRLLCVGRPVKYALSFYGLVDLLAVIPTYISLVLPGSHYLLVIRILRILRIFRVLKLALYIGEAQFLMKALQSSKRKIFVFLLWRAAASPDRGRKKKQGTGRHTRHGGLGNPLHRHDPGAGDAIAAGRRC